MKKCRPVPIVWLITALSGNVITANADDNVTAREKLTEAKAFVANLAADAQLIYVTTEADVELSGKAYQWMYFFKSETNQRIYEIWYEDGILFRHTPLSQWDGFRVRLDFRTLPDHWIDSDAAIAVAEANGGSDFRAAQGNQYAIAMHLIPPFARIYPVTVWGISYRSNDRYFDILVDAATGEVYELPRTTARECFDDVQAAALAVSADARLIRIFGGGIDLEGTSEAWMYLYRSSSSQALLEFSVQGAEVVQTPENETPDPSETQHLSPLPALWVDSDDIILQAEADGGEEFRQDQEEFFIVMTLMRTSTAQPRWEVNYEILGQTQRFHVDALPPITAREYVSVVDDSATAVAGDAELILVKTNRLNTNGRCGEWRYLYQSIGGQILFEFACEGGAVVRSSGVTNEDPSVYLGMTPLPDGWIDSDFALSLAEAAGGETFRMSQEECQIVASLACRWNDPARWGFDYQCPTDAQVFRVDGVLPDLTARESLSAVEAAARSAVPGAELIYIRSDDVNPDGTSTVWKYIFDGPSAQTLHEFWAAGNQAMEHEVTVTDDALESGMTPLPLSWYDSDTALARSEAGGGGQFRDDHADWTIEAALWMPRIPGKTSASETAARWTVRYASAEESRTYAWSAGNFSPDWASQTSGTTSTLRSVDAVSDLVCWASGNQGTVLRTADGGDTWLDASAGLNPENFYSIAGIDALTALIAAWESASAGAVLFRTDDGGSTWTKVYALGGGFVNGVTMFSETDGIAYGDPHDGRWLFLETTDGGLSWETMENAPQQRDGDAGNTAFWLNATVGWIGTNMPWAYRTTDGGATWTRVDVPGLPKVQRIACDGAGNVLVSAGSFSQNTTDGLLRSTDNGTTWESLSPPEDAFVMQLEFHNRRFWLVTGNAVYKSTTLGDAWTAELLADGNLRQLSFEEQAPYIHGWAVGTTGTIVNYAFDTTPVSESDNHLPPARFVLYPNYPNPFNPETTIRFDLPRPENVRLRVMNLLGHEVAVLYQGPKSSGSHRLLWDGKDRQGKFVGSGVYLYEIRTDTFRGVGRMVLLR